jgi:homoserine kinase
MPKTIITVPASTSNLGASFDACGLALALYLRVEVEPGAAELEIIPSGEGERSVPRDETNLIARVARQVALMRRREIGGACLTVANQIPLARGLGSSSAAIIAGISVYEALSGERLGEAEFLRAALRFEGHGDNLAPSLLGGLVVACVVAGSEGEESLVAVKRAWPEEVRLIVVIPELELETKRMRAALPTQVPLVDAVYNVQRAALLQAALSAHRFDLLGEALGDRLHQPYRAPLAPGLSRVLELNREREQLPGLLGVAISGAGSTMIALADANLEAIAAEMQSRLRKSGVSSRARELAVDNRGRTMVETER